MMPHSLVPFIVEVVGCVIVHQKVTPGIQDRYIVSKCNYHKNYYIKEEHIFRSFTSILCPLQLPYFPHEAPLVILDFCMVYLPINLLFQLESSYHNRVKQNGETS